VRRALDPIQVNPVSDTEALSEAGGDPVSQTNAKMWMAWLNWRVIPLVVALLAFLGVVGNWYLVHTEYINEQRNVRLSTTTDVFSLETQNGEYLLKWEQPTVIGASVQSAMVRFVDHTGRHTAWRMFTVPSAGQEAVVAFTLTDLQGLNAQHGFRVVVRYRLDNGGVRFLSSRSNVRMP